jgi:hypothetical protein
VIATFSRRNSGAWAKIFPSPNLLKDGAVAVLWCRASFRSPRSIRLPGYRVSCVYEFPPGKLNHQRPVHDVRGLTIERFILMKNSSKSLVLAAACAGLLGGTAVRMNAQPTGSPMAHAGVMLAQDAPAPAKHACKGKNDCKGQGGGKNAGKNSCKGKGNCATDGSKAPK